MQRVLSTYRYIHHPLGPTLLAEIAQAGIPAIEIFCALGHFNYRSQPAVREVAAALEENRSQAAFLALAHRARHGPRPRERRSNLDFGYRARPAARMPWTK